MELKKIEGFTPGPWFDRKPANSNGYVYVDGQSTRQGRIATCYNTETSIADATLIAYAPELYKLAEQYRDECERLRELLRGQAYSIWKGSESEMTFEEWNKLFERNL